MSKLSATLLLIITVLATAGPAAGANTDVVIQEISYLGSSVEDWVEIKNTGTDTINVAGWWICARFIYRNFAALPLLSGTDLMLGPGEVITLGTTFDLDQASSDFGLFITDDFGDPNDMADFLQYGTSAAVGRSAEARTAGLWTEISKDVFDFIPLAASGESTSFCGDSSGGILSVSSDFVNGAPSQGADNEICNDIFTDGFESGNTSSWSNVAPAQDLPGDGI